MKKNSAADYKLLHEWFLSVYDTHPAKYISTLHYHNSYEIFAVTEGASNMLIDDRILGIKKRDVILIKPNYLHKNNGGSKHSRYAVHFTKKYLDTYFTPKAVKDITGCFDNNKLSVKPEEFGRISALLGRIQSGDKFSYAHLAEIISILSRPESLEYSHEHSNKIVDFILEYINKNYAIITSLDDIAKEFGISKPYMCSLFKKETTVTISQYLNSVRISRACEILKSGNFNITETAILCGYSTPAYFCRIFSGIVNMTPSEYKKHIGMK